MLKITRIKMKMGSESTHMECSASEEISTFRFNLKLTVYVGINMNSLSFIKAISVT